MLNVENLTVRIGGRPVLEGVSFTVETGERVGLVGESGSGKSLTCAAIIGLLPRGATASGSIRFQGRELLGAPERDLAHLRGATLGMVFQEPSAALDPLQRIGTQITSPLRAHGLAQGRELRQRARELAASVGLPDVDDVLRRYPHQLSGGQRQRVMIAMAVAGDPQLVLADEPTTALDVTVQARILDLLEKQVRRRGAALVLVTHDMAVAAATADRLLVMRAGRIVDEGSPEQLIAHPGCPYTAQLVRAAYGTAWERPEDTVAVVA